MSRTGNGYKALGFVVWKGGLWYLRRRYRFARRVGVGTLVATGAVAGAVALAARRNGHG